MFFLLKKEFDYAIRICAFLAGEQPLNPVPTSEIASKLMISKPFTNKLVFQLKHGGLVRTLQGKDGGVLLNQKAHQIRLLDIFTCFGPISKVSDCAKDPAFCPLPATCPIHRFFETLEDTIEHLFLEKTIAEFAFTTKDLKHQSDLVAQAT